MLFDEPEAAPIAASVKGKLMAPALLRCDLRGSLAIEYFEPDCLALPNLARRRALSAYDAVCLQLALATGTPARLAAAWDDAVAGETRENG